QINTMERIGKSNIDPIKLVNIYDKLKSLEKMINSIDNEDNFKDQRAKFSIIEKKYNEIIKIYYDSGKEIELMNEEEKEETKNILLSRMKVMRSNEDSDDDEPISVNPMTALIN